MDPSSSRSPSIPVDARSVLPLLVGYWTFGQFWGAWVVVFSDFLRHHDMTAGRIGVLFSFLTVVSIATMTLVAPRLRSRSLRGVIAVALTTMGAGAVLLAELGTGPLVAAFVVLAVGNGLIDVFMNVAAQGVEVRTRRPVLQWLHASYSVGGITGALGAGLAYTAGIDFRSILAATGLLLVAAAAWNARRAPERVAAENEGEATRVSVAVFLRVPALLVPGFVLLFAFLVEGSMDTWSVIYLRRTLDASTLSAAAAFAAFAAATAIGRIFAGRVLFGLGYRRTILISGVGSFAAGLMATLATSPWIAAVGFLVLGFALSAAAPAAFGLVEGSGETPEHAIAALTTVGYGGFVFGPPLMGWIADTAGLRATMSVLVVATLGVLLSGLAAPRMRVGQAQGPPH